MPCIVCNGSGRFKGLPCTTCSLTSRERIDIRNTIYGQSWRSKLVRAQMGSPRAMITLIATVGTNVLDNRGDDEKAVLRKDLRTVMKFPLLRTKVGTAADRVYYNINELVAQAAQAAGVKAEVTGTNSSGVVDGLGTHGPTIGAIQEKRRDMHMAKAGLSFNKEFQAELAKIRPPIWVCVLNNFTVPGERQRGREALRNIGESVAPNASRLGGSALPGDQLIVPWVLLEVEIDEDMPSGNEFRFKAEKYHYLPSQHNQPAPPIEPGNPFKETRDTTYQAKKVGQHGPCQYCDAINLHGGLQSFIQEFAAASVDPGETHGHFNDQMLDQLMSRFREIERTA